MRRNNLITILLFLLLALILLCPWLHSDEISQQRAERLKSTPITTTTPNKVLEKTSIDYYLKKSNDNYELTGNFSTPKDIETITSTLNIESLTDASNLNSELKGNKEAIDLTQKIIPLLVNDYSEGSIYYRDDTLTIEGMVYSEEAKSKMEKLLRASGVKYQNHTDVLLDASNEEVLESENVVQERENTEALKLAEEKANAEQLAKERAEAERLEAERVREIEKAKEAEALKLAEEQANAKQLAKEKALQDALAIEAEIQKVIDLENITFAVNKAELTPKSLTTINHIATILQKNSSIVVEIGGHTDSDGNANYNLTLSQKRVESVKQKLVDLGISASRLIAVGYGETQPLVLNDTKENKQRNRRVVFKVKGE